MARSTAATRLSCVCAAVVVLVGSDGVTTSSRAGSASCNVNQAPRYDSTCSPSAFVFTRLGVMVNSRGFEEGRRTGQSPLTSRAAFPSRWPLSSARHMTGPKLTISVLAWTDVIMARLSMQSADRVAREARGRSLASAPRCRLRKGEKGSKRQ